ncbi:hypothetical protein [Naasia sp. SYSU D00948]|uniref:DUF7882 family protein n=1 Tax=Naasia sp. SYSU D00948 TaxID=2817379 RepID=UPI001B308D7C|nr:hypothetical protein [Naasia sp. SYSU D00948]
MGKLYYGDDDLGIDMEDRLLAHVKMAIIAKLRRDEKFTFSWQHGVEGGGGRSTIWIHPSIPLRFKFDGSRTPVLNRAWIEALLLSANSTGGLQLIPEPAPDQVPAIPGQQG